LQCFLIHIQSNGPFFHLPRLFPLPIRSVPLPAVESPPFCQVPSPSRRNDSSSEKRQVPAETGQTLSPFISGISTLFSFTHIEGKSSPKSASTCFLFPFTSWVRFMNRSASHFFFSPPPSRTPRYPLFPPQVGFYVKRTVSPLWLPPPCPKAHSLLPPLPPPSRGFSLA